MSIDKSAKNHEKINEVIDLDDVSMEIKQTNNQNLTLNRSEANQDPADVNIIICDFDTQNLALIYGFANSIKAYSFA